MHAFFLRILSRHCRDIWGMDVSIEDGGGATSDPLSAEVRSSPEFQRAYLTFRTGTLEKLRTEKTKTLSNVALHHSIPARGEKRDRLIELLVRYRRDNGWFDDNENLISPLTTQEKENIENARADGSSDEYPISVSDAHTAMEFYLFADSVTDFSELSGFVLSYLYFVKVQEKPAGYEGMKTNERRTWSNARMKTIRKYTKSKLIGALMETRHKEGIIDDSHDLVNPDAGRLSLAKKANSSRGKSRVLGRSRLKEIWNDMEKTTLPSWCSPAPPQIGDKAQGKISADGWRVFCTVHLIVTLGRLWGLRPAESRERQLFANFCDLISATKIAAGRSVTMARIDEFRNLMLKYLSGLDELFPGTRLVPYHHIAIHMTELLSHFGPTTAWRCWVFERYNHMLQNIETNGRFGELEKTLFERMCMMQRLKSLISSCARLEHRIEPFAHQLVDFLNPSVKGTLAENLESLDKRQGIPKGEECWLEAGIVKHLEEHLIRMGKGPQVSQLIGPGQNSTTHARAMQYNKFSYRGTIFSPSTFSIRDSYVAIGKGVPDDWHAGKIKQIFTHSVLRPSEVYFVIQRFKELSPQEASRDPYRRYPLVGGRLYHPELEEELKIVTSQEIVAHFAYTPLEEGDFGFPCFHALPLDKVPPSSSSI
ncbi:hypothetical protein BJY52DRAFT_1223234 [Lactarius psammicola]|nr:hypothetical protein BJY52DRAFT_1223234 [Lactarius psammicola]